MVVYYREHPITLQSPDTEASGTDATTAYAWFYFTEGYKGTRTNPAEPPSVELVDVKLCGASVMDFLTCNQLDAIESELLENVLTERY